MKRPRDFESDVEYRTAVFLPYHTSIVLVEEANVQLFWNSVRSYWSCLEALPVNMSVFVSSNVVGSSLKVLEQAPPHLGASTIDEAVKSVPEPKNAHDVARVILVGRIDVKDVSMPPHVLCESLEIGALGREAAVRHFNLVSVRLLELPLSFGARHSKEPVQFDCFMEERSDLFCGAGSSDLVLRFDRVSNSAKRMPYACAHHCNPQTPYYAVTKHLIGYLASIHFSLSLLFRDGKGKPYCFYFSHQFGKLVIRCLESEEVMQEDSKPCILLNYHHSPKMREWLNPLKKIVQMQEAYVPGLDKDIKKSISSLLDARRDDAACWTQLQACTASRVLAWKALFNALCAHLSFCSAFHPLLPLLRLPMPFADGNPLRKLLKDRTSERLPYGMVSDDAELYKGLAYKPPKFGGKDGE